MPYETIEVPGLPPAGQYSQAAVVTGPLLFVSGQVSMHDGEVLHPGDADAQAAEVLARVGRVLNSGGASWSDVCFLRTFVTSAAAARAFGAARAEVVGEPPPCSTLVIVDALIHPDLTTEVEAVATLPGHANEE